VTPALRERLNEHRLIRQAELFDIAALLHTYDLTPDPGPLRDAGEQCMTEPRNTHPNAPDPGRIYWGYRIESLQLRLGEQRHCRPRAAQVESLVGILSVDVQEYLPATPDEVGESFGHIRRLDAQFWCDADAVFGGETHRLRAAWHVDTHVHTGTQSAAVHPRFHFQVGGQDLAEVDESIRGALMPDAPRPAIAPLDGILAIDFVLSHYRGGTWDELRLMDDRYGRLRTPSMKRYWAPYYRSISEALHGEAAVAQGSPAGLLLPNLVVD
jgi:hypothetical protein